MKNIGANTASSILQRILAVACYLSCSPFLFRGFLVWLLFLGIFAAWNFTTDKWAKSHVARSFDVLIIAVGAVFLPILFGLVGGDSIYNAAIVGVYGTFALFQLSLAYAAVSDTEWAWIWDPKVLKVRN